MIHNINKSAYGDFQTPFPFALKLCDFIQKQNVKPQTIIEPSCGEGNFLQAAVKIFLNIKNITGYDINPAYVLKSKNLEKDSTGLKIFCQDFFTIDWKTELAPYDEPILILGNLPWVTNSAQGNLDSENLPQKTNFLNYKGYSAITGEANFDISEWMLITLIEALRTKKTDIAVLIKTTVARRILKYISKNKIICSSASIYNIDAKAHFNVSVAACLFHAKFNYPGPTLKVCNLFENIEQNQGDKIYINAHGLSKKNIKISGCSPQKWRSGIKHDASKVMELKKQDDKLVNGFGEIVDIEERLIYPLFKGKDVIHAKFSDRWLIVPQSHTGENTHLIKFSAPKTWKYLNAYADILDRRKSIIYKNEPRFSIFGVGDYTFKKWKIAICGLYKKLVFNIFPPVEGKPCVFDDTVYFISFDAELETKNVHKILNSRKAQDFFDNMIFWDDKRPIKTNILNKFNWNSSISMVQGDLNSI